MAVSTLPERSSASIVTSSDLSDARESERTRTQRVANLLSHSSSALSTSSVAIGSALEPMQSPTDRFGSTLGPNRRNSVKSLIQA